MQAVTDPQCSHNPPALSPAAAWATVEGKARLDGRELLAAAVFSAAALDDTWCCSRDASGWAALHSTGRDADRVHAAVRTAVGRGQETASMFAVSKR